MKQEKRMKISEDDLNFNEKGLLPAILQDNKTGQVLMLAYMNKKAFKKTMETGKAYFWSRSRQELWLKGESSGNYQYIKDIRLDCDNDTLLFMVEAAGPACHTGRQSCFYKKIESKFSSKNKEDLSFIYRLYNIITERKDNPRSDSYTS